MTVFERIEEELDRKGMTRAELSRLSGVDESTIRNWKKTEPKAVTLDKVARALGVPLSYLVTGERGEAAPTLRDVYPRLTGDMARDVGFIADIYPDITGTDRSYIMGAARTAEKNIAHKDGSCARDA